MRHTVDEGALNQENDMSRFREIYESKTEPKKRGLFAWSRGGRGNKGQQIPSAKDIEATGRKWNSEKQKWENTTPVSEGRRQGPRNPDPEGNQQQ